MYLKGAYLHIAFGSVHEKFLHFPLNNYCYQCCSVDLYQLQALSMTPLQAEAFFKRKRRILTYRLALILVLIQFEVLQNSLIFSEDVL